jgi:ferrous iron transport protein A
MTPDKTQGVSGGDAMPLGLLATGDKAEVVEVKQGIRQGARGPAVSKPEHSGHASRMEDLGFRPGKKIEMLKNEGRGPMLVKIDESRIAIGRGMAMKVVVRRKLS